MRVTTIVSLGASAVLGIGALFAAKFWLPDSEKDKVVQTAPVVVAASPIEFGTRLDEKNLAVVQLPVEAAPAGSYRTIKEVIALDGGAPVALVKLDRDDQLNLAAAHPEAIVPVSDYPHHGWTHVWLEEIDAATLATVIRLAWVCVAPKRLSKALR